MSTTPTTPTPAGPPAPTRPQRWSGFRVPARAPRASVDAVDVGRTISANGFAIAIAASLALAALSLLYPSTPSYDPWSWIQWGREIVHLRLSTDTGPSWKPLPVFFTTLFAPFGDAAPDLWLVVGRAGGILAVVMVYRTASRIVGGGWTGVVAGATAIVGLLLSPYFLRNTMFGYSEGILIALILFGVERHLDGKRGQAFALLFGAALLRPEAWAFFGLYGVWLFWKHPEHRKLVVALIALIPVLWFLPEWWGSGQPLRAASRAQEAVGGPSHDANPVGALLRRMEALLITPVEVGLLLGVAGGIELWIRRRRVPLVLLLTLGGAVWVGVVAVMTRNGFSGNERYLAMPVAVAAVVAGAGWAWLAFSAAGLVKRASPRLAPVAVVVVVAGLALWVAPSTERLDRDNTVLRFEGKLRDDMQTAVDRAGGAKQLLRCGPGFAGAYNIAMASWMLDTPGKNLRYQPNLPGFVLRARSRPGVYPTPPVNGAWGKPVVTVGEWTVYKACAGPAGGVG